MRYKLKLNKILPKPVNVRRTPPILDENSTLAMSQLTTYLESEGIPYTDQKLIELLNRYNWNVINAIQYLMIRNQSELGIIQDVNLNVMPNGFRNSNSTSCYIDSLIFAMFSRLSSFDSMLTRYTLTDKDDIELQSNCRLIVNLLRSGISVEAETIEELRRSLAKCGWTGGSAYTQEDTSELFLFLTDHLQFPYLPFAIQLHHGASPTEDDTKIIVDHLVSLAITPSVEQPQSLDNLLVDHFFSNQISGLSRTLPSTEETTEEKAALVDAWSALSIFPFYSSENGRGSSISATIEEFPDCCLIFPIHLKRYHVDPVTGEPRRLGAQVHIPLEIRFDAFIADTTTNSSEYRLQLMAAVCHIGSSVHSGHYIGYSRLRPESPWDWLQMDDLRSTAVSTLSWPTVSAALDCNAFLLFYQLVYIPASSPMPTLPITYALPPLDASFDGNKDKRQCIIQ